MPDSYLWRSAGEQPKAVAYYRHSAEDKQENSVPIQRELTQKFAAEHGIDIIHEEADEGKTGLLAARPGFERLFNNWILNNEAPAFKYVLVYDVSRWGRFQNQDEAGFHNFAVTNEVKKLFTSPAVSLIKSNNSFPAFRLQSNATWRLNIADN